MSVFFTGREMVEIAVEIERNGATFYHSAAHSARTEDARTTYQYLEGEERKHLAIFEHMLQSLEQAPVAETYPGEEVAYLRSLAGARVFTDDGLVLQAAEKARDEAEVLTIALNMEKDSILFYGEMRNLVRGADRSVVDELIGEEKSHLEQLSVLRKKLG